MKFSMSVLSRRRTKWGTNHFRILLKALEYGYSTRKTGLRYDGNPGGEVEVNLGVLTGYQTWDYWTSLDRIERQFLLYCAS
jgi:hypothetical protein